MLSTSARLLAALVMLVVVPSLMFSQTRRINLIIADNGSSRDTITFGVDRRATYCIDEALGEQEQPPKPPTGIFDARFLNHRAGETCLGEGVLLHLQYWDTAAVTDTFAVSYQVGSGGTTMTIQWPLGLDTMFTSAVIKDGLGGLIINVNMLTNPQVVVSNPGLLNTLYIICQPKPYVVQEIPPAAPVLLTPADRSTGQSTTATTVTWSAAETATSYHLQVSTDSAFGTIFFEESLTGTSKLLPTLTQSTTYFWRVNATNEFGTGPYASPAFRFTTQVLTPPAPVLLQPANGALNVPLPATARWRKASTADSYTFQISTTQDFSSTIIDSSGITDTSLVLDQLERCYLYYWRARGTNGFGDGPFSTVFSFRAELLTPSVPQLLLPPDRKDSVEESPTLTWTADACAEDYIIHVSEDSLFGSLLVADTVTETSRQIGPLGSAVTYFWRVYARNGLGISAPSVRRFKTTALTTPPAPALAYPANNQLNVELSPVMQWNASTRAVSYRLQIATDANFDTLLFNDSTITGTSQEVGPLSNGDTFFWRVNAKNLAGTSSYSTVWTFTTLAPPAAPFLISPEEGEVGVSVAPRMIWSLPEGADSFHLQLAKDAVFDLVVFEKRNLALASWDVFGLDGNTEYFWRVRARNVVGEGPWSAVSSFTTTLTGTANWLIPLAFRETGAARDTIYFGISPAATFGIDPPLGEYELPPVAPGFFDARFVDLPSHPVLIGEGLRVSFHPFRGYTQIDTFRVMFQTGSGSYPVTISWPSTFIATVCDSMVVSDEFGGAGFKARMDLSSSISISNSSIASAMIVMWGAKPIPTDVKPPVVEIPKGFMLSQNYPNPFNPSTNVDFSTERRAEITLRVYDVLGREIAALASGSFQPGRYTATWNGKNGQGMAANSGVYFIRMTAIPSVSDASGTEPYTTTRSMVMMK